MKVVVANIRTNSPDTYKLSLRDILYVKWASVGFEYNDVLIVLPEIFTVTSKKFTLPFEILDSNLILDFIFFSSL